MQDSPRYPKIDKVFGKFKKYPKQFNILHRLKLSFILSFIFINIISLSAPIFNTDFVAQASPIQDKGTTPTDWSSVGDDNGKLSTGDDLECSWASTARIFCKVNSLGPDNGKKQASFFYDPELSSQIGHTVFASSNPSQHGWIHFFSSSNGDILGSFNIINKSGAPGHEVDSSMGIIENNINDESNGSGYNTPPEKDNDSNFRNANYCSMDKFKTAGDQDITCVLGAGAGGRAGRSVTVTGTNIVKSGLQEANNKKNFDKACQDNGGVLGFFLCPFIELMKQMIGWLIGGDDSIDTNGEKRKGILISLLEVQPLNTSTGLYNAWNNMRDIASGIYIIVFLIIIMGNIFSFGIDNYTAKKLLPKLIIAAILTNLSWIICSLLIDIFNIVGNGIADLIFSSTQCNSSFCSTSGGLSGASVAAAGIASVASGGIIIGVGATAIAGGVGLALIGVIVIFLIGALASTIGAIGAMFVRQLIILGLVFISPVAFALMVLPGTNKFYKKWWENLFKILIMYPLVIGLLSLSLIFADLTAGGTRDNVAGHWQNIIAEALPFFALMMIPKCFKWGGSILSTTGGAMSSFLAGNAKKIQNSELAKGLKERRKLGFSDVGDRELGDDASWRDKAKRKIGNMGSGGGLRDATGMPFKFEDGKIKSVPASKRMPNTKNIQRRATTRGRKENEYYKEYESLETGDLRNILAGAENDMQKAAALTRLYEKDKGLAEEIIMGRRPIVDSSSNMKWGDRKSKDGKQSSKDKRKSDGDEQISRLYFGSDEKIKESSPHLAYKDKKPKGELDNNGNEKVDTIPLFSLKDLSIDKIAKLDGNFWKSLYEEDKAGIWENQLEAAQRKDGAKFGGMDTKAYAKHLLSEMDEDATLSFIAANHKSLNGRTIKALWGASQKAAKGSGFRSAIEKVFEDKPRGSGNPEFKDHNEISRHLYRFNRQDFSNVTIPGFGGQSSFSSSSQYSNTSIDTRLGAGSLGVSAFMGAGGSVQEAFSIEELMTINDDITMQHRIVNNQNFVDTIDEVQTKLSNDTAFLTASRVAGSREAKIKAELDRINIATNSTTGVKTVSFTPPTSTYTTFRSSGANTADIVKDFSTFGLAQKDRIIKTANYSDIDRISHMIKTGAIDKGGVGAKEMAKMLDDRKVELMTSGRPEDKALLGRLNSVIKITPPDPITGRGADFSFK